MVVIYAVGFALPLTHDLFLDDRVQDRSFPEVAYDALILFAYAAWSMT